MSPAVSARLRRTLVATLEDSGCVRTAPVRRAFAAVPRELFVARAAKRDGLESVYRDEPIPTKFDTSGAAISSSSQPAVMAQMLEGLALRRGQRVLEVGTGTGYNAALLHRIVGAKGRVVTIDLDGEVTKSARRALQVAGSSVEVVEGDGHEGWAKGAPYDRILVTASTAEIPRAWFDQLGDEGLVEVPLRLTPAAFFPQVIVVFGKAPGGFESVRAMPGAFMRLRRDAGDPASCFPEIAAMSSGQVLLKLAGNGVPADPAAQRPLLAAALSEPRQRSLPTRIGRASWYDLAVFLAVERPERVSLLSRPGDGAIALVAEDASGLAALGSRGKTGVRIEGFGRSAPMDELAELLDRWKGEGRPGVANLRATVEFDSSAAARRPVLAFG